MMQSRRWCGLHLCIIWLLCACLLSFSHGALGLESSGLPVLIVGEEKKGESLAFFDGSSCEYEVHGLHERKWYEIKISYPASIPASIGISVVQHSPLHRRQAGRKLLNIEKTMFYVTEEHFSQQALTGDFWGKATVVVHPAGVISRHHTSDHPFIIYNILCEEVILGIPKQAWWVGFLAALVICAAFYISAKLPATLVPVPVKPVSVKPRVVKALKEAE